MKKFKVFLFVLLLFALLALWFISTGYYSSGNRAGTISKFGERGYVFKTWEGQLMEGGFSGETGSLSPRFWDFSSLEDSVVVKIQKALATGERITLLYHEKFVKFPWNGETKFMVYDVQFLPPKEREKQPIFQDHGMPEVDGEEEQLPPPPPVEIPEEENNELL